MRKNLIINTVILSTAMTAFAEFQDVGGVMLADPSLTENANVNVVFNNDAGADYQTIT